MSNAVMPTVQVVVVDIGGIPIRLSADSDSFLRLVRERYSGFLSSALDRAVDLAVNVSSYNNSEVEDICVARHLGKWRAERADFRLDWDSDSKSGNLDLTLNAYSLDAALRILHTLLLAENGGFLLHAASSVRQGRAFLFFGPSGAGKTTVARLALSDTTLLSDEISYVRPDGPSYVAHGTPFTGELAKSGENISAPIAGLYQLVKASTNRVTPMKQGDAARSLLESVLFFAEDPDLVKLVFKSVCDVVCRLPVYRLEFVPDRSFWNLVQ